MGVCGSKKQESPAKTATAQSGGKYHDQFKGSQPKINFGLTDMVVENSNDIRKEYAIEAKLGNGAYGEVRKAKHIKTGTIRAVKIIKKSLASESDQKKILEEVVILKRLVVSRNSGSPEHHPRDRVLPRRVLHLHSHRAL